ncbi:MAG TPA: gephyrin-like molybdotransferase Glp [Actinomycetota bacterium]|nr:gephyrin-like molybdotransferase Glp [Actinomycetota bacterium]
MLSVEEARARILARIEPLPATRVMVNDALGMVAAEDLIAPHQLPRFANSAMDGWAVRAADVLDATPDAPVTLSIIGEVRAGDPTDATVHMGTTMGIMTGAPVPRGADAVVPMEQATEAEGRVVIAAPPPPHGHIRSAGEDIEDGAVVVRVGDELGPGELAILASLGLSPVLVHHRPRVAVLVTGDELVAPETEPGAGQIRDSNTVALRTLVLEAGGEPVLLGPVADDLRAVVDALDRGASETDLVISAGGVSVGRYDFVKSAVEELGGIEFWRVAMQPGKPVVLGHVGERPFLGLPGNPVSIHVGFEQFVRPAILKLRGFRTFMRPVIRARLTGPLTKPPGRLHFVRVRLDVADGSFVATPLGPQGSHIQSSLVGCSGLALFHIEATNLATGDEVDVQVWSLPAAP